MTQEAKTIVVLIALAEEYAGFQAIFEVKTDRSTTTQLRLEHHTGRDDIRVISVLAEQMGSQSALMSASQAIEDFSPDLVVVLGIAGGLSSDVMIGDVCISNEILDVLHNTKVMDKNGSPDITFAPDFYNIDAELVSSFVFFRVHPGSAAFYTTWRAEGLSEGESAGLGNVIRANGPDLVIGPIACGPVVASRGFNDKLKSLHRKVTAIETESGGVFCRIATARIPAIAIRGISDLADAGKQALEKQSGGSARRLAMANASRLLKQQIQNERFVNVATRQQSVRTEGSQELFPRPQAKTSVISDLDAVIRAKLAERSPEFKAKPDSFYLPVPRAQKINYADDLSGNELDSPENLIDCLTAEDRIIVRLPRSYPSQALGWSLAYSLIRQQIDGKAVLPYVVDGEALKPPQAGFERLLPPAFYSTVSRPEYSRVVIIEEPSFSSRHRMKFLEAELGKLDARVLIITKAEDRISAVDDFVKDNGFKEYELAPVSFSETAFFLEKAFDMTAREAEAVAIRLDDTFRKFRLDAHPIYFAGIQEETLAALINANKRAELIQLAVDALLSLMVAADKSSPPLSRTTRERFLRALVVEMSCGTRSVDDIALMELATDFLGRGLLPTPPIEFLTPFFEIGLLYRINSRIFFTHPYLESYLLAQALRDDPLLAQRYFRPDRKRFNFYAFDLYCEIGPASQVVEDVLVFAGNVLDEACRRYPDNHPYLDNTQKFTALSSPRQLVGLTEGLMATAERMEKDDASSVEVRGEKQRLLDAKRYVRRQVKKRGADEEIPLDMRGEFETLDGLSRALSLVATAVGAGSESIAGEDKVRLSNLVLRVGDKFSDVWTRNRLRLDFAALRNDILSDENIWVILNDLGEGEDSFAEIRADLELFVHSFELNTILEPMGRVFSRIAATAGVRVLAPVVERTTSENKVQNLLRAAWMLEADSERGRDALKVALSDYNGSALMRVVLANHLLWRAFWHHYKTAGSRHFVNSARRALRPLNLSPTEKRLEEVRRGPNR